MTGEWTVFTEKNAPMEEIWNYAVNYDGGDKVYLAVWGSGVLEYTIKTGRWKEYLDPDGEMEIDLYRDDGINHVIVTGASPVDGVVWVSTYFGGSRYDGRHWRGYAEQEGGLPSDFNNNIKGRSAQEALFCSDKGLGIVVDGPSDPATWVAYTRDPATGRGRAKVTVGGKVVEEIDMPLGRAPQLHDRGRRGRQRHLGGHRQGPRLGHRRRLLPRDAGTAVVRIWPERPGVLGHPEGAGRGGARGVAGPRLIPRRPRRRPGGKP